MTCQEICKSCRKSKVVYKNFCHVCRNNHFAKKRLERKAAGDDNYLLVKLANMRKSDINKGLYVQKYPTLAELKLLIEECNSTCCYSGVKLQWKSGRDIYTRGSFDRIDNSRGHSLDNIQCSSVFMNTFRGSKSDQEFRKLISNQGLEEIVDYEIY